MHFLESRVQVLYGKWDRSRFCMPCAESCNWIFETPHPTWILLDIVAGVCKISSASSSTGESKLDPGHGVHANSKAHPEAD